MRTQKRIVALHFVSDGDSDLLTGSSKLKKNVLINSDLSQTKEGYHLMLEPHGVSICFITDHVKILPLFATQTIHDFVAN